MEERTMVETSTSQAPGEDGPCGVDQATFQTRLNTWFRSLSPEDRSSALAIGDPAFLSTLIHFGALSSSRGGSTSVAAGGGGGVGMDGAGNISINWSQEFLFQDIEDIFRERCDRFEVDPAGAMASVSSENLTAARSFDEKLVAQAETTTSDVLDESRLGASESQLLIAEQRAGSDAFRIQGEEEGGVNATAEKQEEGHVDCVTASSSKKLADILSELCVVFPSGLEVAKPNDMNISIDTTKVDGESSPILNVPAAALKDFDLNDLPTVLSDPKVDWIASLRQHMEKTSQNDMTVPLSLMALSRMQVAAGTFYVSQGKSDGVECSDGVKATEAPVAAVEDNSLSNLEEKPKAPIATNDGDIEKRTMSIVELVSKYAPTSGVESVKSTVKSEDMAESLPLVPPAVLDGVKDTDCESDDFSSKKFLTEAIEPAAEDGEFTGPKSMIEDKLDADISESSIRLEGDLDYHDSQLSTGNGKKKRKKKKKKRKTSNADSIVSMSQSESGMSLETTPVIVKPRHVALSQSTKEATRSVPLLPMSLSAEKDGGTGNRDRELTKLTPKPASAPVHNTSSTIESSGSLGTNGAVVKLPNTGSRTVLRGATVDRGNNNEKAEKDKTQSGNANSVNDDEWETVSTRSKTRNRNKMTDSWSHAHSNSHSSLGSARKAKPGRTPASRRRNANRKVVRDILGSVLDAVDVEVCRKQKVVEAKVAEERRKRILQSSTTTARLDGRPALSMRDVVMGKHAGPPVKQSKSASQAKRRTQVGVSGGTRRGASSGKGGPSMSSKGTQTILARADQSTTQTLPETLSSTSANTHSSYATEEVDNVSGKVDPLATVRNDTSSVPGEQIAPEPIDTSDAADSEKDCSPPPPLPTLWGPGNEGSASSSVASSLEAPHGSSHRHHYAKGNENDVGYHLLDVCDRISRDMDVFMARRALALTARRRERGLLHASLQEVVTNIWGTGCVEMYGSCATGLDLPSSDLDAVIMGLDYQEMLENQRDVSSPVHESTQESTMNVDADHFSPPTSPIHSHPGTPSNTRSPFHARTPMMMSPYAMASPNAERVMMLAAELERQPWAVQVKPIPTASVPVVKILADPSKLPGGVSSSGTDGDWMMQQHQMAAQAAVEAARITPPLTTSESANSQSDSVQAQFPAHTPPPWRGTDVVNGLFKMDITFEGPEHGGVGSTTYSAEVIQEACREHDISPDGTPFVQVLMVLKELLAQRRLNEPFSGGLSSYALLLLVVGVMKERKIIREELERIERHRELVTSENAAIVPSLENPSVTGVAKQKKLLIGEKRTKEFQPSKTKQQVTVCDKTKSPVGAASKTRNAGKGKPAAVPATPGSSWASIARKNVAASASQKQGQQPKQSAPPKKAKAPQQQPKVSSFAEAVSGKQSSHKSVTPRQGQRKQDSTRPKGKGDNSKGSGITHASSVAENKSKNAATNKTKPTKNAPSISLKAKHSNGLPVATHQNSFVPLESTMPSLFPQGCSNDVLEVLCSGETSAGKLLMHFLLFYGEHLDARTTAIDVAGYCNPDFNSFVHLSPYAPRRSGGSIDPVTGMLTVDPIVVYDPWEGGQGNNVARSCYAWTRIQSHFAQCYMTLSSAVERSGTSSSTADAPKCKDGKAVEVEGDVHDTEGPKAKSANTTQPPVDSVSPLLELLLSF